MKSRNVVPLHLLRWMRKMELSVSLKPHTKFVDFGYGLIRMPSADAIPAYRWRGTHTRVVRREDC